MCLEFQKCPHCITLVSYTHPIILTSARSNTSGSTTTGKQGLISLCTSVDLPLMKSIIPIRTSSSSSEVLNRWSGDHHANQWWSVRRFLVVHGADCKIFSSFSFKSLKSALVVYSGQEDLFSLSYRTKSNGLNICMYSW